MRFVWRPLGLVIVFVTCAVRPAWSQSASDPPPLSDVEALRQEIEALRREHAERLAALEAKLSVLTAATAPAAAAPTAPGPEPAPLAEATVPAGAAGAGGPTGVLPVYGAVTASSKIFNPDIAVVGNFLGAVGKTPGGGEPALELREAEASFQAVVDPYARADFFVAYGAEGAEIEEGFVTFPTLPGGFLLKAGKTKASFGKVNTLHAHALLWTDRPLVMQSLLGGEEGIADGGLSLSRLIPNDVLFLEATGEVFRGGSGPFQAEARGDLLYVGRLRGYRDLTESTNLDLGGSIAYGTNDAARKTRLVGADATFRFRPLRRAIYKRLLARTELVWSRREEEGGRRDSFGMYASAEYQFARRWFAGARFDRSERALDPSLVDEGGSLLLTYWPSEFSQIRAQYRHTRLGEGRRANELLFQFLFSIGAHGAHSF